MVKPMAHTLQIRYPATGVEADLAITEATIKAPELRKIVVDGEPLATFDPGFVNTAVCHSSITYIDGEAGVLEYRGYPIAELAEHSTYLEVAYLLLHGELPNATQLAEWELQVTEHRMLPDKLKTVLAGFPYDAHPMTILMASVAAFFSFYPDAQNFDDPEARYLNITRLIAKMPTLAAFAYRKGKAKPYINPDDSYGYCHNFLQMLFKQNERRYHADPRLIRAMEVLFILHADHEQNCSTNAVRSVASSGNDLFTSCSAGIGALHGPLHGGANEAVLKMLREIGTVDRVPEFIEGVKAGKTRMMGFGHRGLQELRSARQDHQEERRGRLRGDRGEPAAAGGARVGEARPGGRLLRFPQAVPERRLLLRPDLRGPRLPAGDVHRAVRGAPDVRLGGSVSGVHHRPGAEDRSAQADLHRPSDPQLRADGGARLRASIAFPKSACGG